MDKQWTEVAEIPIPTTAEYVKPYDQYWQYKAHNATFLYGSLILLVVGTIGNVLCLRVLLSKEMRSSGTNLILTVMAVSDLALLHSAVLRRFISFATDFTVDIRTYNIYACRVHLYFSLLSYHLSPNTLALMTVERAISVCFPLKARYWCSRGNTIKALIALFVFLAAIHVTCLVTVTFENALATTGNKCYYSDAVAVIWYHIQTAIQSYIPFTIIIIGNTAIIHRLYASGKKRQETLSTDASVNTNTTMMLVVVSLVFMVTNLPYSIYGNGHRQHWPMYSTNQALKAQSMMAYAITYELSMTNNAINFLLYCIFGREFRKAFFKIFRCTSAKTNKDSSGLYSNTIKTSVSETDTKGSLKAVVISPENGDIIKNKE